MSRRALRSGACLGDEDLQGVGGGVGRQFDGGGGFGQRETVRDEWAHIKLTAEHQPGYFLLQGEIGRIAAQQVFLVHADGGQVQRGGRPALGVGEEHELPAAAQPALGLTHCVVRRHGDHGRVQPALTGQPAKKGERARLGPCFPRPRGKSRTYGILRHLCLRPYVQTAGREGAASDARGGRAPQFRNIG